jgi:predicted O-methyltransferase YrrM
MNNELPLSLKDIYSTGYTTDRKGERRKAIDSTVSEAEVNTLMKIVSDLKAVITLETGVAFGASAIAICYAKKDLQSVDKMHYGVDPNQSGFYANAANVSLEREKLDNQFTLLEGPSHTEIPKLIDRGVKLDFAFIDGWHTFDYTLIDFFLIDKMLKVGGMVAFHDMQALSKQKVLRFILNHRKYKIQKQYAVKGNESLIKTLKFFVWRGFKYPLLLRSWFYWHYQLFNSSGLIVLQKMQDFEPNYDFFKRF